MSLDYFEEDESLQSLAVTQSHDDPLEGVPLDRIIDIDKIILNFHHQQQQL